MTCIRKIEKNPTNDFRVLLIAAFLLLALIEYSPAYQSKRQPEYLILSRIVYESDLIVLATVEKTDFRANHVTAILKVKKFFKGFDTQARLRLSESWDTSTVSNGGQATHPTKNGTQEFQKKSLRIGASYLFFLVQTDSGNYGRAYTTSNWPVSISSSGGDYLVNEPPVQNLLFTRNLGIITIVDIRDSSDLKFKNDCGSPTLQNGGVRGCQFKLDELKILMGEISHRSGFAPLVFRKYGEYLKSAYRHYHLTLTPSQITLKLSFDQEARVRTAIIQSSTTGNPLFDSAVLESAASWKFREESLRGKTIILPIDLPEDIIPTHFR